MSSERKKQRPKNSVSSGINQQLKNPRSRPSFSASAEPINKKIQEFSPFSACVIPFTEEAYSIGAIPVAFLNCFEK